MEVSNISWAKANSASNSFTKINKGKNSLLKVSSKQNVPFNFQIMRSIKLIIMSNEYAANLTCMSVVLNKSSNIYVSLWLRKKVLPQS